MTNNEWRKAAAKALDEAVGPSERFVGGWDEEAEADADAERAAFVKTLRLRRFQESGGGFVKGPIWVTVDESGLSATVGVYDRYGDVIRSRWCEGGEEVFDLIDVIEATLKPLSK
jgi:hypothetical protein